MTRLRLHEFRCYARADVCLGAGLTVVHGPNGAGKTNLLEALYFGCTGHSCRTGNERELVRFDAPATRVQVTLRDGAGEHQLSVGFEPGSPKRLRADGVVVQRLVDVEQRPLVSVFMPDRLELVKGVPALRRAHLDQVVSALWPVRAASRREYAQALAQRNALLARSRAGGPTGLAAWDSQLAQAAVQLQENRAAAVALLADPFARHATALGLVGEATVAYRPRSRATNREEFVAELQQRRAADLERGFTTRGPHRDDVALLRSGRELRAYGSQGEQRVALLALLLAEREALAAQRGRTPLMLLDDVMSELDRERRGLLASELAESGQSVITTTDLAHVPGAESADTARLRVAEGSVLQEALAA